MLVVITPSNDTSEISFYRSSAGGSNCEVLANASPLSCLITDLPAGSSFAVETVACASNGVCSSPIIGHGYTLPDGIFGYHNYSNSLRLSTNLYFSPFLPAVLSFTVSSVTQTSWNIDMVALSGNPAVDRYVGVTELGSFKRECSVKVGTYPLRCPIAGLSRNTRYTTSVRACLPASAGCGEPLVLTAGTRP